VSLAELDLGGNTIGLEGAQGLGAGLVACSTLTSLDLEDCSIEGEVVVH
jgi:Ran GTPase-activating protein (RanGAP) involved in mRNA processing and transport